MNVDGGDGATKRQKEIRNIVEQDYGTKEQLHRIPLNRTPKSDKKKSLCDLI